jgi:plastocyanin
MTMIKKSTIIFLNLALAFTAAAQTTVTIGMTESAFTNANPTITVGDQVTWNNTSSVPHTSTSGSNCTSNGVWDSGTLNPGATFSRTFTSAGTFPYYCAFHCAQGMTGTITVQTQVTAGITKKASDIFKVFPNPSAGNVKISLHTREAGDYSISLVDLAGKEIMSELTGFSSAGEGEFELPSADLEPGLYFIKVRWSDEVYFDRLVKQ